MNKKEKLKFHPGYYLNEIIADLNITVEEFSKLTQIDEVVIKSILENKMSIDSDVSKKLSDTFDLSQELWSNLQKQYDNEL